ncbi:Voltage-dependent T-type calcium channel subunit alpha-1I [Anabarilius grahami]|uniref:Voltage-dependent T-type calcium channel subunit alpha-1I n=1 Tax=Anabarilius grahami TaxID=495550 RepID=A0A3N0Y4C2_ANAGA|nr:Voltage-dependent T-type calcium channel subunit alpha-1I [Anabarilius grahami]
MVILLNCITLGMYEPCEDIDCTSERCHILQQEEYSVRHRSLKKAPWAYNLNRHVASARGSVIKVQAKQTDYKGGHPSARAPASQ